MGPPTPPSPSKESHHPDASNYYYLIIAVAAVALLLVINIVAVRSCSCCGLVQAIRRFLLSLGVLAPPLEDEQISRLVPACKYRKELQAEAAAAADNECSVCLTVFAEGEDVRQIPECKHSFHAPCIDKWLRSHVSCPLCRGNVLPAPLRCPKAEASHHNNSLIVSAGAMTGAVGLF